MGPRRAGRGAATGRQAGPAGAAYMAIGDHWRWFGRVVAERKVREGDPIIVVLEQTLPTPRPRCASHPGDADLLRLRDWLSTFLVFVRLFDRAVGLVSRLEPTRARAGPACWAEVPDDTILRLDHLLDGLADEDVLGLVDALSRLSPTPRAAPPADVGGRPHAGPLSGHRGAAPSGRGRAIIDPLTADRTGSNGRRPRGQPGRQTDRDRSGGTLPIMTETSTWATKKGLAQMLKGGVIMDVVTPEQAKIAEEAGAVAVMALERVPADIRAAGGVARMSDPAMIEGIMDGGLDPGDGEGPHRPLRRGAGARGARRRLHRRVRGPHSRRRDEPHRQARLQGPVRVRLPRTSARRSAGSTRVPR